MATKLYKNKARVYVTGGQHKGKTFEPGQLVDALEHIDPDKRDLLVLRGVFEEVPATAKPVASGGKN